MFGNDLGVGCFMTLSLRLGAKAGDRLARWMDANFTGAEHFQSEDIEVFRGATANDLSERRDANAHEFTAGALLCLLLAQVFVADHVHRLAKRSGIVAA